MFTSSALAPLGIRYRRRPSQARPNAPKRESIDPGRNGWVIERGYPYADWCLHRSTWHLDWPSILA
jgi:hypothetical protein